MFTAVTKRANALPSDMGVRLLNRLYPGQYGGTPQQPGQVSGDLASRFARPKSPTGLPVYTPPPPAPRPNAMGTQATAPAVQPATPPPPVAPPPAAAPAPVNYAAHVAPPAQTQGMSQIGQQLQTSSSAANDPFGVGQLDPAAQKEWGDYWNSLYAGPDYKGRNEANHMLGQQYAQMLQRRAREAPIDYSGGAQIGQYYDRARSRQMAQDAAMGRSGGGVGAAGQSALYGQQGSAVADMVRQLLEQRRRERTAQEDWMRNLTSNVGMEGLQRNWKKQDSPKWWQQALGTLGSLAGDALGGGIHLGGGNNATQSAGVNTQPLGDMGSFGASAIPPDQLQAMFQQFQQPDQLDPFGQYQ